MQTVTAILAASLALSANAHMFISSPQPIEGTAPKDPLDPSGSNFPCHGVSLPSSGGQKMAAGSNQLLAFALGGGANTAVHGGGSCQMAVTYATDAAQQKNPKNWKVIYSIEGGCPTDAKGNLASAQKCAGGGTECVNQFNFKIPKGLKDGHAIMAWTWFNNVGNREMYMNCINAEITGGDGSEMSGLPTMFVANLASVDQCPTTENVNVKFPNAGKYVTTKTEGGPYPLAVPTGQGCSGDGGSGGGQANSASSSDPAPSSAPAATPTSQAAPAPSSAAPKASQAPASSAPAAGSGSDSGSCTDGTVPCPTPGQIICIDLTHFGTCDIDNCAVPMPVAPGTTCKAGKIAKRRKRALDEHKRKFKHGHHH